MWMEECGKGKRRKDDFMDGFSSELVTQNPTEHGFLFLGYYVHFKYILTLVRYPVVNPRLSLESDQMRLDP